MERPRVPFHRKLGSFIFVAFAFELGVFLLVFPWLGNWGRASIPGLTVWLGTYWGSSYLRGAISGLGALDLYVSLSEFARLRRSWGAGR